MSSSYNTKDLPTSKHYYVDIMYSTEYERDVYFAVNKQTDLPEIPFVIYGHATGILDELEEAYSQGFDGSISNLKPKAKVTKIH